MKLDDALRALREVKPVVSTEFGVAHLSVFGSVSRGDATGASDVDALVELEPGQRYGCFLLFRLQERVEGALR